MNKNYYDILQINKNASPEIIEKAYKTLAKKYHPDLQSEENKKDYEEILKEINEAYEVLSNPEKKALYDKNLKTNNVSKEDYDNLYNENQYLKNELNNMNSQSINPNDFYDDSSDLNDSYKYNEDLKRQQEYYKQLQQAQQKAYYDAYIQDLKNRGYKIKYKKTWKDYVRSLIALLLTIVVLFLVYQIPFVKGFFHDLYEQNSAFQYIIDLFNKFLKK